MKQITFKNSFREHAFRIVIAFLMGFSYAELYRYLFGINDLLSCIYQFIFTMILALITYHIFFSFIDTEHLK